MKQYLFFENEFATLSSSVDTAQSVDVSSLLGLLQDIPSFLDAVE